MTQSRFSNRILRRFVETASIQLGMDQFNAMLALAKLPPEWARPETFNKTDAAVSAQAYASLQSAMRTYFGRGARVVLLRVGQGLWNQLVDDSGLTGQAQAAIVKRLPLAPRRKSTLDLLARFVASASGDITVHTLDLDFLLVDHASPTTEGQSSPSPICYVTQGLIRESLYWSTGQNYDVEETACKACGESACEFKITSGK